MKKLMLISTLVLSTNIAFAMNNPSALTHDGKDAWQLSCQNPSIDFDNMSGKEITYQVGVDSMTSQIREVLVDCKGRGISKLQPGAYVICATKKGVNISITCAGTTTGSAKGYIEKKSIHNIG
jgi:hypothetical protein